MLTGKEIDEYVASKYSNSDNKLVLTSLIRVLHKHEESDDKRIKKIVKNFKNIQALCPTLSVHHTFDRTNYLPSLSILNIKFNEEDIKIAHELGHVMSCIAEVLDGKVDDSTKRIFTKAKNNCTLEKNKDKFKDYLSSLTDKNQEKSEFEEQVVSDILSAIFKADTISLDDKDYHLKYGHEESYYKSSNRIKWDKVVYESFADYYVLTVYNRAKELELLKEFLGEDYINYMNKMLDKISKKIERPNIYKVPTLEQKLGSELINVRMGNLPQKLPAIEDERNLSIKDDKKDPIL